MENRINEIFEADFSQSSHNSSVTNYGDFHHNTEEAPASRVILKRSPPDAYRVTGRITFLAVGGVA